MTTERMVRPNSCALDEVLGVALPVLDEGFVRAVDYMGTDASIVQAARVSYGTGTKTVREDRALIRYLLRNRHTTPFEMCEIKLHVRVPMDTWRQWIRHRTASVNEYSTRYSVAIDAFQKTPPDQWRLQSSQNKQGSTGTLPISIGETASQAEGAFQEAARVLYQNRLQLGIAREQARKDLPLSTYTEAYWKIDLHNLLHFLSLRMDAHAQHEIRQYATIIGTEIVARWCPEVWAAFQLYGINTISFSDAECKIINMITSHCSLESIEQELQEQDFTRNHGPTRELREFEGKLDKMGISIPWSRRE
jgi:thymidylate synthase (FAD)